MGLMERAQRVKSGAGKGLLARAGRYRSADGRVRQGLLRRASAFHIEKKNTPAESVALAEVPGDAPPENGIDAIREALDRKVLDLTNLFEISKEINGTLDQKRLLDTLLFSGMGQMGVQKICVCAALQGADHSLQARKGLDSVDPALVCFPASGDLVSFFNDNPHPADIARLKTVLAQETIDTLSLLGAALVAPMINQKDLVGFLILGDRYGGLPFGRDDKEFMGTLASMAAISMENTRLYGQLEQKLNQLSALYDISRIINSTAAREQVLDLLSETLSTGFKVTKAALWLHDGGVFRLSRLIGIAETAVRMRELSDDNPEFEAVLSLGEAALFSDYETRDGLRGLFDSAEVGVPALLLVPLLAAGRKVGVLVLLEMDSHPDFRKEDKELFSIIASQMAPPVLMAGMVEEAELSVRDPFTPFLERMETVYAGAEEFALSLGVILIRIRGLEDWVAVGEGAVVTTALDTLGQAIRERTPEKYDVLRAGSASFVLLLPGAPIEEQQELEAALTPLLSGRLRDAAAPESIRLEISLSQIPEEFRDPAAFVYGKGF